MKELNEFYLFYDCEPIIEKMPSDMAKKLWLALFHYAKTGMMPEGLTDVEQCIFYSLKEGIDEAKKKHAINQEKGRKGMESRWHKTTPETPQKAKEEPKPQEPIKSTIEAEKPKRNVFKPPTIDEVQAYCNERKNGIDAEAFVAFYTSKNWMIGKNKMSNWKMAVITWEKGNRRSEERRRKEDVTNDRSGYSTDDFADFIRFEQEEKDRKETL